MTPNWTSNATDIITQHPWILGLGLLIIAVLLMLLPRGGGQRDDPGEGGGHDVNTNIPPDSGGVDLPVEGEREVVAASRQPEMRSSEPTISQAQWNKQERWWWGADDAPEVEIPTSTPVEMPVREGARK